MLHAQLLKGLKRIRDSQLVQGVGVPALYVGDLYLTPNNRNHLFFYHKSYLMFIDIRAAILYIVYI